MKKLLQTFFLALVCLGFTQSAVASIDGDWRLVQVTCNGSDSNTVPQSSINNGSAFQFAHIDTNSGMGHRDWLYSSCFQSVPMVNVSATSTNVSFTDAFVFCSPSTCDSSCGAPGNNNNFAYALSNGGNTLSVTVSSYSPYFNPCAGQSTPIVAIYERLM